MWFSAPTFPLVSNELFRQPIVDTSEYLVYLKFSAHLLYDLDQIFISDSFSTKAQTCHGNLPGFLPWRHPYALRIFQHITCWKKNIDLQLSHVPIQLDPNLWTNIPKFPLLIRGIPKDSKKKPSRQHSPPGYPLRYIFLHLPRNKKFKKLDWQDSNTH